MASSFGGIRSLRAFFNGKFLLAVVIFYTCSHLVHVELIADETNNAASYPDADQHLPLQKPTQTVVDIDGRTSTSASENSRTQAKPTVAVGGSVNGEWVSAKDLIAAQDAMNGIQPTVEGVNRTAMSDGMRMMLCGDPPNVATLIKAHYCDTKLDPTALQGLQGIPLRPFGLADAITPTGNTGGGAVNMGHGVVGYPARRSAHRRVKHRRVLMEYNSIGDGSGVDDTDGEDETAEKAEDAADRESFADVVSKVNSGLAPVPGSGQVFVHKENAMLFGRGLAAEADANPDLLPPDEAAAISGHMYRTCSVVGSSGILRKTAYGAMIDSADAVFRINQAPTIGGCALFTGGRTSVRVINAHWLHKYSHGDQLRRLPVAANATLVVTRYEKTDYARLIALWKRYRPDVKIRLLTRDTMHGATLLLHSFREKLTAQGLAQTAGGESPSSGIITLYLALRLCERVTVYGYGLYVPPKAKHLHDKLAWYHYFRGMYGKKGMDQTHSFDGERLLYGALARAGHVKMCGFRDPDAEGVGTSDDAGDAIESRIKMEMDRHTRRRSGGVPGELFEDTPEGRRAARQARRAARRGGARGAAAAGAAGGTAAQLATNAVVIDPSAGMAQSGNGGNLAQFSSLASTQQAVAGATGGALGGITGAVGGFSGGTAGGLGVAGAVAGVGGEASLANPIATQTVVHIDEQKWNKVLGHE